MCEGRGAFVHLFQTGPIDSPTFVICPLNISQCHQQKINNSESWGPNSFVVLYGMCKCDNMPDFIITML